MEIGNFNLPMQAKNDMDVGFQMETGVQNGHKFSLQKVKNERRFRQSKSGIDVQGKSDYEPMSPKKKQGHYF